MLVLLDLVKDSLLVRKTLEILRSLLLLASQIQLFKALLVEDNVNFNGTLDVDTDFAVKNCNKQKFFVDNVTGNTNIEGTLTADGHTELNSTLNVDAATTLGSTLVVLATEFNNTVDVDANFAVRSGSTTSLLLLLRLVLQLTAHWLFKVRQLSMIL